VIWFLVRAETVRTGADSYRRPPRGPDQPPAGPDPAPEV